MELYEFNQNYVDAKDKIKNKEADWNKKIEKLEKEIVNASKRIGYLKVDKDHATSDEKKAEIDKKIEDKKTQLEKKKTQLTALKEEIANTRAIVNNHINELRKNPEMKEHIDNVISKKAERQVNQLSSKKDSYENLKKFTEKNPDVHYCFMTIEKLNRDLSNVLNNSNLTDSQKNAEVAKINSLIDANKKQIYSLCKQRIPMDIINSVDSLKSIDKQIKGLNNSISDYSRLINKDLTRNDEPTPDNPSNDLEPVTFFEKVKDWWKGTKVYKFFKGEREPEALPEPENSNRLEGTDFKNSMKYQIVRDEVEKQMEEKLKQAKKERKTQERNNEGR